MNLRSAFRKRSAIAVLVACLAFTSVPLTPAYADEAKLVDVSKAQGKSTTTICIDPGHGGYDSGAVSGGLREATLTLKIGKYLRDELTDAGYNVVMTRQSDTQLSPSSTPSSERNTVELRSRAKFAKQNNADLFVSLHINSGGASGAEVWMPNKSSYLYESTAAPARKIAKDTLNKIVSLGFANRGTKAKDFPYDPEEEESTYPDGSHADYFGVIRHSRRLGIPAYLVEHGFIDHAGDRAKLSSDSYLRSLAKADAEGIMRNLPLKKAQYKVVKDNGKIRIASGDAFLKNGWVDVDGNSYYVDNSGYAFNDGPHKIGGETYFFTNDGTLDYGIVRYKGKTYYYDWSTKRLRHDGWIYFWKNEKYRYADLETGELYTGYQTINGKVYFFDENGLSDKTPVEPSDRFVIENGVPRVKRNNVYLTNQWYEHNGEKYYLNSEGYAYNDGPHTIDGKTYFFTKDGTLDYGVVEFEGKRYYYDWTEKTLRKDGWIYFWKQKAYVYADTKTGELLTGYHNIDGKTYFFDEKGHTDRKPVQAGEQPVFEDGVLRVKKGDSYLKSQWYEYKDEKYYLDKDGFALHNGPAAIGDKIYFFTEDGTRDYGVVDYEGKRYYFDWSEKYLHHDGWIHFWKQDKYVYADKKTGELLTGYQTIDGKIYFFDEKGHTDRKPVKTTAQFVIEDGVPRAKKGDTYLKSQWFEHNGEKYYLDENGFALHNGPAKVDGKIYFFLNDGTMDYGVVDYQGKRYYYDWSEKYLRNDGWIHFWKQDKYVYADKKTGELLTGYQTIDGKTYFFDEKGHTDRKPVKTTAQFVIEDGVPRAKKGDTYLKSQWFEHNGEKYYLDENGFALHNGPAKVDGKIYFFLNDGTMDYGVVDYQGKRYYYDWSEKYLRNDGWIHFWKQDKYVYADKKTGELLTGYQTIDGKTYFFDAKGHTDRKPVVSKNQFVVENGVPRVKNGDTYLKSQWFEHNGEKYFLDKDGYALHNGPAKVDGKIYFFLSDGTMDYGVVDYQGKRYYYDWSEKYLRNDGWIHFWKQDKYVYADKKTGELLTGYQDIDGKTYYFDAKGHSTKEEVKRPSKDDSKKPVKPKITEVGDVKEPIMGSSKISASKMAAFYNKTCGNRKYPAEDLKKSGAPTIDDFCKMVYEEATAEGVRAEVLFAQILIETNYLQSDYARQSNNFGGIGVLKKGDEGNKFSTVREGLRAQAQHLKAYGSDKPVSGKLVDPRFNFVKRNSCTLVNRLGGGFWAAAPVEDYAGAILRIMNGMYKA